MIKFYDLLDKYRDTVANDSKKARRYIQQLDYRDNPYLLNCIAQTYLDEARFEDNSDQIRDTINFRKWRMAEKYVIEAFKLNSNHAEILYTMGEIRKLNFQDEIAIYCFEKIIGLGVKKIEKQEYSRGRDFAKELINDSKFELYRLHFITNQKLANKYLRQYQQGIKLGIDSIYIPLEKFLL
ncbi:MAG: hypothetical protein QM710_05945 [Flavobacterium sp.]